MLLRPGDVEWTVVERTLEIPWYGSFCAAYHDGTILVTMGNSLWRIITPNGDVADDVLVQQKQWKCGTGGRMVPTKGVFGRIFHLSQMVRRGLGGGRTSHN
jgi:hypothetical protein